jgi:hypothetical protein
VGVVFFFSFFSNFLTLCQLHRFLFYFGSKFHHLAIIIIKSGTNFCSIVYYLQFYVRLGLDSSLNERQIMEDIISFGTGNMPQTWPR